MTIGLTFDDPASIPWWDQLDVEGDTDTPRWSNLDSDVRIKNMRPVDVQILCVVSALQLGEKMNERFERHAIHSFGANELRISYEPVDWWGVNGQVSVRNG